MPDNSISKNADGSELSRHVWLTLPLALFLFVIAGWLLLEQDTYVYWFEREIGFIELATPTVLIIAVVYGIKMLKNLKRLPVAWLRIWVVLITLSCVYFAGEELSWGQQIFGWDTPENIKTLNDQQETNIHNMSSWFDQKPRFLLELWVIFGGIFIAAWRKLKSEIFDSNSWQYWFWPGFACFPAALLAEIAKLPKRMKDVLDVRPDFGEIRYSELQELMFAAFLFCYLLSIYKRLKIKEDSN